MRYPHLLQGRACCLSPQSWEVYLAKSLQLSAPLGYLSCQKPPYLYLVTEQEVSINVQTVCTVGDTKGKLPTLEHSAR